MAKKNKNKQEVQEASEEIKDEIEPKENSSKVGYRIVLKTKTFIIIDKYGINVKIKLPMQELVKYQLNDLYYL